MTLRYLQLYLDNPKVGCGWRCYLVLGEGRKWAKVISTATGEVLMIDKALLGTGRPLPLKRTKVARRLRENARKFGLEGTIAYREAMGLLKA